MTKTRKGKLKKQTQFIKSGYELKISNNKVLCRKIEIWALKKQSQFKANFIELSIRVAGIFYAPL